MLYLTARIRNSEDAILIGDNVVVRVMGVQGNQVTLGFDAPKGVPIFRSRVLKKQEEAARKKRDEEEIDTTDFGIDYYDNIDADENGNSEHGGCE